MQVRWNDEFFQNDIRYTYLPITYLLPIIYTLPNVYYYANCGRGGTLTYRNDT